jgi:hypothetical protein
MPLSILLSCLDSISFVFSDSIDDTFYAHAHAHAHTHVHVYVYVSPCQFLFSFLPCSIPISCHFNFVSFHFYF